MFKIESLGEFNIFCPHPDIIPASRALVEAQRKINDSMESAMSSTPVSRITGSFIYAHPPDYRGVPSLDYSEKDWQALFAEMRSVGIDTVIFQASLWNELGECYYRTDAFRTEYRLWPVLENLIPAVRSAGMTLFLGGYGSAVGWSASYAKGLLEEELRRQLTCIRELMAFREGFSGIYFTPETAVGKVRQPERERFMNELYRRYFSEIKEMLPDKQCAISPATKYGPEAESETIAGWLSILEGVPCDVIAPQDSIGTAGSNLRIQPAAWRAWGEIAQGTGLKLWANVELFERVSFGGEKPFISASPERVRQQLSNVGPHVEKVICWEYPYFVGKEPGQHLKRCFFSGSR